MNFELSNNPLTAINCKADTIKRPMSGAERVAKTREKERLVKEGKYVASPLEQAKELLAEM